MGLRQEDSNYVDEQVENILDRTRKRDNPLTLVKNAEKNGTFDDQPDGIEDIKDAEENVDNPRTNNWANNVTGKDKIKRGKSRGVLSFVKKKGPIMTIIITLVGGGIGIGGLLSPGGIFIFIKETLVQRLNDSDAALSITTNKVLAKKFKGVRNSFSESSPGKCGISCRMGSMNDATLRNLRAKGFTVEVETSKGLLGGERYQIKSLMFPGTEGPPERITTGDRFTEVMKNSTNYEDFKKVFNSKTAFFLNTKFGQIIYKKFGLDKLSKLSSKLKEGATNKLTSAKERVGASIREAMGLEPIDPTARKLTAIEKLQADPKFKNVADFLGPGGNAEKFANKTTNIIGSICAVYNISKGITLTTKMAKIAKFTAFAMFFLSAADQIKAGAADPDVISALGDQLTQPDANGNSATDSIGYRMGAYGDSGSLSDEDKKYSPTLNSTTAGIMALIAGGIAKGALSSLTIAKKLCSVTGSQLTALLISCPAELVAALAAAPTVVGSAAAVLTCGLKVTITMAIISGLISAAIGRAVPAIVDAEMPNLDENTVGAAVGNSIYSGTSQILGGMSASYGLKAGNQSEIRQYAIDTAVIRQRDEAIARREASNTPFDIYNQYSFLGSIAKKINITSFYNSSSFSSFFGSILSIVPRSFSSLTSSVGAEANSKAEQYAVGKCDDWSLQNINIDADAFCNPSYVMSSAELNSDIDATTEYMIEHEYIDEYTGEVIYDPNDTKVNIMSGALGDFVVPNTNKYKKYLDNCANRIEPLGETATPIESTDFEWAIGLKCTENSDELSYFRTYTMNKSINDTLDE